MFRKVSRRNCAIASCTNSWYKLEQWKSNHCPTHNCNFGTGSCVCSPPFRLFPFPTERKDPACRLKWASLVNRKNGTSNWKPNADSRICSKHFEDGEPTTLNPYPTLELGYTPQSIKKARPPPTERCDTQTKRSRLQFPEKSEECTVIVGADESEHVDVCTHCTDKLNEINALRAKNLHLASQIVFYKKKIQCKNVNSKVVNDVLKSDKKCKFYTGIPSVKSLDKIFDIIEKNTKQVKYWKGPSKACNPLKYKRITNGNNVRRLSKKEEFVLTLMKLRLGLLFEDLADRFQISVSHASRIFTTWIKILSDALGSLIFNPTKEIVKANLPPSFKIPKYSNVRHIIDCTEVFLEKPSNPQIALNTWSNYKSHHTAKYLLSINPSGLFNFVSDSFGGRYSDKYVTQHSGFLDILERYDTIMADKGFLIREELALIGVELFIPPGRRGVVQMSSTDVKLTKEIANRRIHIEQAIRRVKSFRFFKFEIPLTLAPLLDDCMRTVCGLCNLYPPIPKYN